MEETTKTPLDYRKEEVAQYESNIALYRTIANSLPSEWPERLVQFKGATNPHEVIGKVTDLQDVELITQLWAHDHAEAQIRSEMVELAKSKAILAVLEAQA